jgi:hypothetical protein
MATSCKLIRNFCKEKKPNTNLVSVPIDDERNSGDILWDAFFALSVSYPEHPDDCTRRRAVMWLDCLDSMLSVVSYRCSYNMYKANFDLNDVASSKQKMVDYFVGLHNSVSENLEHMSQTTSDEVITRYSMRVVDASKKVYRSCPNK